MKAKLHEKITVILFCVFLIMMTLFYLVLPKVQFSQAEKRYLEEFPQITWRDVSSGKWGDSLEKYMADHIPGRNFWVGLNAYIDLYTGRQVTKDVWKIDSRLVEAPVKENDSAISSKMQSINRFADIVDATVDLAIIPSAGWATGASEYRDKAIIESIYTLANADIQTIDMRSVFQSREDLYYATDHHWTSAGAYEAYSAYMTSVEKAYKSAEEFQVETIEGFQGSTYSRSALWLTPSETIELWKSDSQISVTNGECTDIHQDVFYRERLQEADKYTVYLDGNHSIVRTYNPNGSGKLLVVRDSFANCLGCFLAESYEEVVLVDLRYYKQPVSDLINQENFERVLICYSLSNFIMDANLIFLK